MQKTSKMAMRQRGRSPVTPLLILSAAIGDIEISSTVAAAVSVSAWDATAS